MENMEKGIIRPSLCFEVEKILGVSDENGSSPQYHIQWAPLWVSGSQLVGCEHLIRQFIRQQQDNKDNSDNNDNTNENDERCEPNDTNTCTTYSNEATLDEDPDVTSIDKINNNDVDGQNTSSHEQGCISISNGNLIKRTENSLCSSDGQDLDNQCTILVDNIKTEETMEISDPSFVQVRREFPEVDREDNDTRKHSLQNAASVRSFGSPLERRIQSPTYLSNPGTQNNDLPYLESNQIRHENNGSRKEKYANRTPVNSTASDGIGEIRSTGCSYQMNIRNSNQTLDWSKSEEQTSQGGGYDAVASTSTLCVRLPNGTYKCLECDKIFRYKPTAHMRVHSGERPYECHMCGKTFAGHSSLQIHLQVHTGHKPFKCEWCAKAFYDKSNYKKHLVTCKTRKSSMAAS